LQKCLEDDEHTKAHDDISRQDDYNEQQTLIEEEDELVAESELFYRTSKEQDVPANSKEFLNNLLVGLHH